MINSLLDMYIPPAQDHTLPCVANGCHEVDPSTSFKAEVGMTGTRRKVCISNKSDKHDILKLTEHEAKNE